MMNQQQQQQQEDSLSKEKNASKNQLKEYLTNESSTLVLILFLIAFVYIILFIVYLSVVHSNFLFKEFYPKLLSLQPGPLLDQRFNFFWWCLLGTLLHLLVPICVVIISNRMSSSFLLTISTIIIAIMLLIDIIVLGSSWFFWVFANNPYIIANPCNDPTTYCSVYGNIDSTCPDGSYSGVPVSNLVPNVACINYIWFSLAFFILDLVLLVMLPVVYQFNARWFAVLRSQSMKEE
jgi:hypothetical protein